MNSCDVKSWKTGTLMAMFAVLLVSGCMKKAVKPTVEKPPVDEEQLAADAEKPFRIEDVVGQDWKDVAQLANARFEFDQASLSSEARSVLQKNAKFLKDFPQMEVRMAGHCDDRGTVEYNIALGQRRARAARDYYKALGVSENRLSTISFGEERPLCTDETDECWAKNRRAETKVRVLSLDEQKPAKKGKKKKTG